MLLFRSVKVYLPETFTHQRRSELTHAIEHNGGAVVNIQAATHIVTNSHRFQGWQDAHDDVQTISDLWVDRSMILGQLLSCEFYSADPGKIFSGVVACASGISAADLPIMEAGITSLGGQWRHGLSKDVTHLFVTSAVSEKYAIAIKYQDTTRITVLLPHWFDDAMRLGSSKLPTAQYKWPDPQLLHPLPSGEKAERSSFKLSTDRRAFFRTAIWDLDKSERFPGPMEPAGEEVWGKRTILLSSSLKLDDDKREVVEEAVEAAGGVVLRHASGTGESQEQEEYERVSECDVFVTRWRTGKAFFRALEESKVVGTLNWLFYVHATGTVTSPMDELLHFPVQKAAVSDDFAKHQITVTNYTGEARDYLKALIRTMGATFTPNMTGSNTILIAAHMGGIKTTKALAWSIPVVNHVWLEDCFVQWRNITPAVQKYISFPPNVDFAPMLGNRGLLYTLEDLAVEEEQDIRTRARLFNERPPVGTEASAKEVEGILHNGDVLKDDDALQSETCLLPARRIEAPGERRMVSASVSPSKNRGTEQSKSIKAVTFSREVEANAVGPSNRRSSKASGVSTTTSKSQPMVSASNDDEVQTEDSDPPSFQKRARSGKPTVLNIPATSTVTNEGHTSSSSGKRKRTAGLDLDSPPRKILRTGSMRAVADERTSPAKARSKRQPAVGATSAKALVPSKSEGDSDEVISDVVNHPINGRTRRSRGNPVKVNEKNSIDEKLSPKASKSKTKAGKLPNTSSGSRKSTTTINIMSTVITLPDHVLKALMKLGAKTTTQVSLCTHLIAPSVVRTEKFLCALAAGAFILSEKWATESIAANKLLPEEDYILRDKVSERKWNFSLVDAMAQAKKVGGKLFENQTFYVTPRVPIDTKLLKTVVTAQGGKLSPQTPTMRLMNTAPNRYVISCSEDISVWRPLAEHHIIYSQELLLMAALTQDIDWENPAFHITESD